MHADDYQKAASTTGVYGLSAKKALLELSYQQVYDMLRLQYATLKLNGEAGELAEQVGKAFRDDNGTITRERKEALIKELGDVLWYCAAIATELEADLSVVMHHNLEKLQSRKTRDQLHGSGDDR